jgi:hypothetical protein
VNTIGVGAGEGSGRVRTILATVVTPTKSRSKDRSLRQLQDQRITSKSGVYAEPAFAIAFKDAAYGFATMQAKNKQLAFMLGIQDKSIQIKGNPALVIWFQGLTKYLKPRKRPATAR